MRTAKLTQVASAIVMAIGLSTSAMAADTSSSMRGKILNPDGNAAANVKITVLHQPSGTTREFITNDSGSFVANGLRVGGPYTVVIDSDTYSDASLENIFLNLGDTFRVNQQLESLNIERIEVTGNRYLQTAGGSNSVFGGEAINNAPSFNRDIKDVARMNPLATINGNGELVFAGSNPRTNSLTVDGISQNDDFGLNYGGYPTQQPPVALDAIEQISVDVSPFSAKKGNFGGGTVNAVTKSGSNDFTFSGFAETSTPSMAGDVQKIDAITENGRDVLDADGHKTYETSMVSPIVTVERFGFNVGGPIIKDKLFFFANFEAERRSDAGSNFLAAATGVTGENVSRVSAADLDMVSDALFNQFGYETGPYQGYLLETNNQKGIFKLDWNASKNTTITATYNFLDAYKEKPAHPSALGRRGPDLTTLQFKNSGYRINNIIHSGLIEAKSIIPSPIIPLSKSISFVRESQSQT